MDCSELHAYHLGVTTCWTNRDSLKHGGPALETPGGVRDDGIHPGTHEEGVDGVGLKTGPLSDGARHNCTGGGCELQGEDMASIRAADRAKALRRDAS